MKDEIISLLDSLGISYRWEDHEAVFTVEESQNTLVDKTPVKNLLIKEKGNGRIFLVIMHGLQPLDMKTLPAVFESKRLSFASADTLKNKLGVTPGSVSLFSLLHNTPNDVEVIVEAELLEADEVGFHPNENTATIFIPGSAIEKVLRNTGNQFRILSLK